MVKICDFLFVYVNYFMYLCTQIYNKFFYNF